MATLNEQIKKLEYEIAALKSKVNDLSKNTQSKALAPYTKIGNSKSYGWYFIKGKWVTYAIYAD